MTDALENLFMQFPADVRITIANALQGAVAGLPDMANADDAADVLTRLGYPLSRAAAEDAARNRAAR